jgi:cytochrome c
MLKLLSALPLIVLIGTAPTAAEDASSSSAPADTSAIIGDVTSGAAVFKVCTACHAIGPGATNRLGPELNGLIGRPAASVPGYSYSTAMKNSGLTWDVATFQKYIDAPRSVVPGTKMTFGGIHDPKQIDDLTAYLASFNADGTTKQP